MPDLYTIRVAGAADLPALIRLCQAHAAYEQYAYRDHGQAASLAEALADKTVHCLVVEWSGIVVGYATYMKQFSTWEAAHFLYLDCLYLEPEARNYGIGQAIIHRIAKEAEVLGCGWLEWQTPSFNVRAIKFYQRIGALAKTKERFF